MEEENSYFKNVVRDALDDLKSYGSAFVFYEEQVQAVKEEYDGNVTVEEDNGIYKLTGDKIEKRGKRR